MVYLTLLHQSFKNIHMSINLKEDSQVEIESNFSFNISYNEDDTSCIAELKQILTHKTDPQQLNILVESKGQFVCEGIVSEETKKEAHVVAYTQLFPYVQNMVAQLTVSAGLPPLMISMAKMNTSDVKLAKNS